MKVTAVVGKKENYFFLSDSDIAYKVDDADIAELKNLWALGRLIELNITDDPFVLIGKEVSGRKINILKLLDAHIEKNPMKELVIEGVSRVDVYNSGGVCFMDVKVARLNVDVSELELGEYRLKFSSGSLVFDANVLIISLQQYVTCLYVEFTEEIEAYKESLKR